MRIVTTPRARPGIASQPEPPYYAVIFTSQRGAADAAHDAAYAETAGRMAELAAQQPGYLGVESARGDDGLGITVSYWRSLEDIASWRREGEHTLARERGRADWYEAYALRIAKIERSYGWDREDGDASDPGVST